MRKRILILIGGLISVLFMACRKKLSIASRLYYRVKKEKRKIMVWDNCVISEPSFIG